VSLPIIIDILSLEEKKLFIHNYYTTKKLPVRILIIKKNINTIIL